MERQVQAQLLVLSFSVYIYKAFTLKNSCIKPWFVLWGRIVSWVEFLWRLSYHSGATCVGCNGSTWTWTTRLGRPWRVASGTTWRAWILEWPWFLGGLGLVASSGRGKLDLQLSNEEQNFTVGRYTHQFVQFTHQQRKGQFSQFSGNGSGVN